VSYISTGRLGATETVELAIEHAYSQARQVVEGQNAQVYPVLAQAAPAQFGLCIVATDARVWERGDARAGFAMMSVAKPFTFALVCAHLGAARARAELGVNATGAAYSAVEPVLSGPDGRTNPMVNAGAIATCARLPGASAAEKWTHLVDGLSAFAGRRLAVDEDLYDNVMATNVRNRELTEALAGRGLLAGDPEDALELYSKQSCLEVSAYDLAVMGAALADGGVNPVTGVRVIAQELCHYVLAVMATAGMYERSGDWLYEVGLPGKSGLGGGIVTVSPGKAGLGSFSPPLDEAGNSVRGVRAAAMLAEELGLGLFGSERV
jgi:glutaminase